MANLMDELLTLGGTWRGTTRLTWEPGSTPIENPAEARVTPVANGHGLAIETHAAHGEDPSVGMMLVSFDPEAGTHALSWIDSFHAAGGMQLMGAPRPGSLVAVHATYAGDWGWTIRLEAPDANTLMIVSENVPPGQAPYVAVETRLTRR